MEINPAFGFDPGGLAFLEEFSFLTGFEIIHHGINDISPVHVLGALRNLSIQTYCQTAIDFEAFPHLEAVRVYWRESAASVFRCVGLTSLFLEDYRRSDISELPELTRLNKLEISNSPVNNIEPVAALRELRSLALINLRRLRSLRGVERLLGLEHLEIDGSKKLRTVHCLADLKNLRYLKLANCGAIDTLQPLSGLPRLERFLFWEDTTIVDGDLSYLCGLPLKQVAFRDRRHYSHKQAFFQPTHACELCGYDIDGLAEASCCPVCGDPIRKS